MGGRDKTFDTFGFSGDETHAERSKIVNRRLGDGFIPGGSKKALIQHLKVPVAAAVSHRKLFSSCVKKRHSTYFDSIGSWPLPRQKKISRAKSGPIPQLLHVDHLPQSMSRDPSCSSSQRIPQTTLLQPHSRSPTASQYPQLSSSTIKRDLCTPSTILVQVWQGIVE